MRIKFHFAILIFFFAELFLSFPLLAAPPSRTVDSLVVALSHSNEDTATLNVIIKLCRELNITGDYQKSNEYALRALSLADKLLKEKSSTENNDYQLTVKKYKADALNRIGHYTYSTQTNDSAAMEYYRAALKIAEENSPSVSLQINPYQQGFLRNKQRGEAEVRPLDANAVISPVFLESVGESYNGIAEIFLYRGHYAEALQFCLRSLKIEEALSDKSNMATTRNWMAVIYEAQDNYTDALKCVLAALRIAEQMDDKVIIADCYGIMGNIYDSQADYSEALNSYSAALKIEQAIGSKKGIANAYQAIGFDYSQAGNYSDAMKNTLAALSIFEEIGIRQSMADCDDNIGMIYRRRGKYAEALEKHFEALKIYQEAGSKISIAGSFNNIANAYIGLGNYAEALQWLNKAVSAAKEINSDENLRDIYSTFSDLYKKTNDYPNAFKYHTLYSNMKDSLLNEKNSMQMAEMRTIYETEKKDNEIALLNSENKIKEEEVKKQKLIKYGAFSLIAVVLLMAGVFINNQRIRYKAAQIIQRNDVRQKISRDLHDEIGSGLTTISMIAERAKMEIIRSNGEKGEGEKVRKLESEPNSLSHLPVFSPAPSPAIAALEKIRLQSRGVTEKLREVVWATNPENDNLEVLLSYIRDYISKFFENSSIEYSIDFPDDVPPLKLQPDVSRNLLFVLKEALNNSAKHSGANKVEVSFQLNSSDQVSGKEPVLIRSAKRNDYLFSIKDNGKGINYEAIPAHHNGLDNMRKRITEIKGKLEIKSSAGEGTRIEIKGWLS